MSIQSRRAFLKTTAAAAFVAGAGSFGSGQLFAADDAAKAAAGKSGPFKISLAEWSLNRAILKDKTLDHLDFAKTAKEKFGIDAVEYVNQMFMDKGNDKAYLAEMKKRADDLGVRSVLIMCDREGDLGDPDEAKRIKAVENHHKCAEAAKFVSLTDEQ